MLGSPEGGRVGVDETAVAPGWCRVKGGGIDGLAAVFAAGREGLRSCWLFLRDLLPGPEEKFLAAAMDALRVLLGDGSLEANGELAAEDVAEEWTVDFEGMVVDASRAADAAVGRAGLKVVEPDGGFWLASASPLPAAAVANLSMVDGGCKIGRNESST